MRPTPTKAEARLRKNRRDNKLPIGKQHADNQSEEDNSHRGGKVEKGEETGRGKRVK